MSKKELLETGENGREIITSPATPHASGTGVNRLTGEEKKIFDAAFIGVIVGAGLTALLFIFL